MWDSFGEFLQTFLPESIALALVIVIQGLFIIIPLLILVAYMTYAERKVIGYMQGRLGPNRVGPKGLLQPFADFLKLVVKEIIFPTKANLYLYFLAPVLAIAPAIAVWAVVPLSAETYITRIDVSLLYVLAIGSIGVYGIILAGWASNSKYPLLGAVRSASLLVSYEIVIGFALIPVVMLASSVDLVSIVEAQSGSAYHWFAIPLFPMLIVFFISALVETNRAPFDVVEGESEIVGGTHVEYSGMTYAVFFLAEYMNMILMSVLAVLLFFGGWLPPHPALDVIPGFFWLALKVSVFLFLYLWIRATFPRFRYDQIMRLSWKVFLPITIVWIFVVALLDNLNIGVWFV